MGSTERNPVHHISLFDLIQQRDLDEALAAKLVDIREDGAGLRILNYSDAAIYMPGAWINPAVRQCRGIIVDEQWRVVARPWAKFFNHGQAEAGELDLGAPVEVTDKMDGSLGIIHRSLHGELRVASRGSFESDQALHATDLIQARYPGLTQVGSITALVEIVYPTNRIVVDYGDLDDLLLLGGVDIVTGAFLGPEETAAAVGWSGPQTETFAFASLGEALAAPPRPGREGLCVRRLDRNQIVKIKQEDYVGLHKIVAALADASGRKEYAEAASRAGVLRPYLFLLLDGRDPRPSILKTLKPAGDRRARPRTEAVA